MASTNGEIRRGNCAIPRSRVADSPKTSTERRTPSGFSLDCAYLRNIGIVQPIGWVCFPGERDCEREPPLGGGNQAKCSSGAGSARVVKLVPVEAELRCLDGNVDVVFPHALVIGVRPAEAAVVDPPRAV